MILHRSLKWNRNLHNGVTIALFAVHDADYHIGDLVFIECENDTEVRLITSITEQGLDWVELAHALAQLLRDVVPQGFEAEDVTLVYHCEHGWVVSLERVIGWESGAADQRATYDPTTYRERDWNAIDNGPTSGSSNLGNAGGIIFNW